MYTEKQAAEKWCPRTIPSGSGTYSEPTFCHGSACMAWRWAPNSVHGSSPIKEAIAPLMPPPNPDGFWVKGSEYSRDIDVVMFNWGLFPHRGYCGLAGRPEVS